MFPKIIQALYRLVQGLCREGLLTTSQAILPLIHHCATLTTNTHIGFFWWNLFSQASPFLFILDLDNDNYIIARYFNFVNSI